MQIENKIAVVTGAASGIGQAIALRLAQDGATAVGMVDLADDLHHATAAINTMVGREVAVGFQGDVTCTTFRTDVFRCMEDRGTVRICVPAAGILHDARAVKMDQETGEPRLYDEGLFRKVMEINLVHPIYWGMAMMAGVAKDRATHGLGKWTADEEGQGAIILIGSISCRGNPGQISYASAKSGLNAAAKTLNAEGAAWGIQAKILHPGFVATPMLEQLPKDLFEGKLRKSVPIDRTIEPAEIADVVVSLIRNPALSGPVWVDGGFPPLA